ncbi:hypothetical protein RUND412_006309 [Rhizina undulata]
MFNFGQNSSERRRRSMSGLQAGISCALKTQDLSDGVYEDPFEDSMKGDLKSIGQSMAAHPGGTHFFGAFTRRRSSVGSLSSVEGTPGSPKMGGPLDKEGTMGGAVSKALEEKKGEKK